MRISRYPWGWHFILLVSLSVGAARDGTCQDRLSRLEWFAEGGGSFLNLGNQPNQVSINVTASPGYLISPNRFSSSELVFTGLRYRLTPANTLEVSYDGSFWNHFQIQPTAANTAAVTSRFERNEWSFNYVRYLPARGTLQPFVTAGAGAIQSATAATQWHPYNPSINFGMGTDLRINERLAFRLEVRDRVGFLPPPLRGASHDLSPTAGLVFSPKTSSRTPSRFPQVEIFLEGGASVLTDATGTAAGVYTLLSNGQTVPNYSVTRTNYFSKGGRVFAGFRVFLTENNAVEFSYAESPNGYAMTEELKTAPPATSPLLEQVTVGIEQFAANYVRYFSSWTCVRPFVTGGTELFHYDGRLEVDISNFGWNAGAGVDVPLAKHLSARFEVRDYMARQPELTSGIVQNFAPTAGLAYRFN